MDTRRGVCPYGRCFLACESESVPQRELNQPRRTDGTSDFAERTVRRRDGFDIGHCGIAKIGVVPDIEEIRGEAQALPLGDAEILDQREVPVLLRGATEDVAAKIAEAGGAKVGIDKALRWIELRSGGEGRRVQVSVDA